MAKDFDDERKAEFLHRLAVCGNLHVVCRALGMSTVTVQRARKHDGAFAEAYDEAMLAARWNWEAEAVRRGVEGIEKPIYYKGECVDTVKEYSDSLLIFLLRGAFPDRYKDRVDIRQTDKLQAEVEITWHSPDQPSDSK